MSLEENKKKWVKEFEGLQTWEEKFGKIIEIGKELPEFPEEYRTEENRVSGCVSKVWVFADSDSEDRMKLFVDSDSLIVKGLVGLLFNIYNGAKLTDILTDDGSVIKAIGLEDNLSPNRINGLYASFKQIKIYALVLLNKK